MKSFSLLLEPLIQLFFPHVCMGCEMRLPDKAVWLCLKCRSALPATGFHLHPENPLERLFYGRLNIEAAAAIFYFSRRSLVRTLVHQLKYGGNRRLGNYLGELMGFALLSGERFRNLDLIIPLPLHEKRRKTRGYNQAALLATGISSVLKIPIAEDVLTRSKATRTQTRKGRLERWQNMKDVFRVYKPEILTGKHILLVDDVITTGATLEACGKTLLQVGDVKLSLLSLCWAEA